MTVSRSQMLLLALIPVAALAACSDPATEARSTRQVAEETINSKLADELDLGDLVARCPEVNSPAVNSSFLCMATTSDDQTVRIEATINQAGRIDLATENVVRAEALDGFESRAVADLNGATGSQLLESDLECGDQAKILNASKQMVCAVNNNNQVYDVTFTVDDIERIQFDLEVARLPRQ